MKIYWALVGLTYRSPIDGGYLEQSLSPYFKARNNKDAVESAVRFAKDRERALGNKFASLKVGTFNPMPVGVDGTLNPPHGWNFFEWKGDVHGDVDKHVRCVVK